MRQILLAIVVLCAVDTIYSADKGEIKATDLKHDLAANREIEFTCTYTGDEVDVGVYKQVGTGTPVDIYKQPKTKVGVKGAAGDTIGEITPDAGTDTRKLKFTVKNVKKDAIAGDYYCQIPDMGADSTPKVSVHEATETVQMTIESKQSGSDAELKGKFKSGDQLNAACTYGHPTVDTFVRLEFYKGSEKYYDYVTKAEDRKPHSAKGIDEKNIAFVNDKDNKVELTIKDASEDTQGDFRCDLIYSVGGKEASPQKSENVKIEYKSGAASTMVSFASISTLLMAFAFVRSNL